MSDEKNPVKVKRIVATNNIEQREPSHMQIKGYKIKFMSDRGALALISLREGDILTYPVKIGSHCSNMQ